MELKVIRMYSADDFTIGSLYEESGDRKFLCFTLEDEARVEKVYGETRPCGALPGDIENRGWLSYQI